MQVSFVGKFGCDLVLSPLTWMSLVFSLCLYLCSGGCGRYVGVSGDYVNDSLLAVAWCDVWHCACRASHGTCGWVAKRC